MPTAPRCSLVIPCGPKDDALLSDLLASVAWQDFPKDQLEVLVIREGTSESAKAIGIRRARGQVIGLLCADNTFGERDTLSTLVTAAEDPQGVGAYSARYAYVPTDHSLTRYFALLGANDPLCWWLGKADRVGYLTPLPYTTPFYRTFFDAACFPSVGDNGCFYKADALHQVVHDPDAFGSCMCACEDLRRLGYNTWTIVGTHTIRHNTASGYWRFLGKRYRYVRDLYWRDRAKRRWHQVASYSDWLRTLGFAVASLCVLPHLWLALRGYRRVRDPAWFWHPLVCGGLTCLYFVAMGTGWWRRWSSRRWTARTSSRGA